MDRAQRHAERGEHVPAESLYRDAAALLKVALARCRSAEDRDRLQRYIESTERRLRACESPEHAAHHVGLSVLATDSRMLEHHAVARPIAIPGAAAAAPRRAVSMSLAAVPSSLDRRARFCGSCGMRYADDQDQFCQMCGTQRGLILAQHGSAPCSL